MFTKEENIRISQTQQIAILKTAFEAAIEEMTNYGYAKDRPHTMEYFQAAMKRVQIISENKEKDYVEITKLLQPTYF